MYRKIEFLIHKKGGVRNEDKKGFKNGCCG